MRFDINVGLEGFLKVQKFNKDGVIWEEEFPNTVLYQAADHLLDTYGNFIEYDDSNGNYSSITVGTDNTTPDPSQTGLLNQVGSSSATSITDTYDEIDMYIQRENFAEFSVGSLSGNNLTEVGLKTEEGLDIARQLFRAAESVTDEVSGTGDGATKKFTFTVSGDYLLSDTIQITADDTGGTTMTVTDDGNGNLTGDVDIGGNNTVNYRTGEVDVTFASAVGGTNNVLTDYDWKAPTSISMTSDDGLRVWYTWRFWFPFSSTSDTFSGSFTLTTDSGDVTVDYTVSFVSIGSNAQEAIFSQTINFWTRASYVDFNGIEPNSRTIQNQVLAQNNSGVATIEYVYLWEQGKFNDTTLDTIHPWSRSEPIVFEITFDSGSEISNVQDTEEIEITIQWSVTINSGR